MTHETWYDMKPDMIWHMIWYIGLQSVREISAIIVTDDYLCYKEPKIPYNFSSYFNI